MYENVFTQLDLNIKTRSLQMVLQERCKKHIKAIREEIKNKEVMR